MPYTYNDDAISLVDVNLTPLAVTQSQAVDTSMQPGYVVAGISGSTANFMKVSSDGTVFVTGSVTVNNTDKIVQQGLSGSLPWKVTGTILSLPFGTQTISGTVTSNQGLSGSHFWKVTGSFFQINQPITQSVKIDQAITVPIGGTYRLKSYPEPKMSETTITASVQFDEFKNLMTRGSVHTDEQSFRDDFSGTSLLTTLTGTYTFTSGSVSVTGVGTLFTTEIDQSTLILPSAAASSFSARIRSVESDTSLTLFAPYTGATTTSSALKTNWITSIGTGTTQVVTGSLIKFTTGTTNGSTNSITRFGDYLPVNLTFNMSASQRIVNSDFVIGFQDVVSAPTQQAVFVITGTGSNTILCRSSFAEDSMQETIFYLSDDFTITTNNSLLYEIGITPSTISFVVNGVVVAAHKTHLPQPYTNLNIVAYTKNTGVPASSTTVWLDGMFFQNVNQVHVGGIFPGEPIPVKLFEGGTVAISYGGGDANLPKMINFNFNKSEGAIIANEFKRIATYVIPLGFTAYLIKFVSYQNETAISRIVTEKNLGTFDNNIDSFVAGDSYISPQWAATVEAEVTTAFNSGPGTVMLTVTYSNEAGVSGRTGTIQMYRPGPIGTRAKLLLQSGDLGVSSVQNITTSQAETGVIKILGLLQLTTHQDQSTNTQLETNFAPGAVTFPTQTVLGIEYAGGTVSKTRNFDALIQLL